jgi:hypothetical protein
MSRNIASSGIAVCEKAFALGEPRYVSASNKARGLRAIDLSKIAIAFSLTMAIADWFSAIRAPLWLDETNSYYSIAGGFWRIWSRQGLSFPLYSYILWVTKSLFGSSEVVLRMPSVIAMLGAVYLLYRIARELFASDVAGIVTVVFCLNPIVSFEAVDARPYAFAALVTNGAILCLLRWLRTSAKRDAIFLGALAAGIFYFHYLFSVIVLALLLIVLFARRSEWRKAARELSVALIPFSLMMLPVFSRLVYLVETRQSHVYTSTPLGSELIETVAPGNISLVFLGTVFLAIIVRKLAPEGERRAVIMTCLLLGAIPLMTLYGVSRLTPIHVFLPRYRLVALPGIALCWGLLVSRLNSKLLGVVFCVALIVFSFNELPCSTWKSHGYSWKDALEIADANAAPDRAPLLIASGLIESDFDALPSDVENSPMFSPLTYYQVHERVVPLPRDFTPSASAQVNKFLAAAIPARQRFLVVVHGGDVWPIRDWITSVTKEYYSARAIGVYDGISVTEYVPH